MTRRPAAGQLVKVGPRPGVNLRIQSDAPVAAGLMDGCRPRWQASAAIVGAPGWSSTWLKRAEGRHGFRFRSQPAPATSTSCATWARGEPTAGTWSWSAAASGRMWPILPAPLEQTPRALFVRRADRQQRVAVAAVAGAGAAQGGQRAGAGGPAGGALPGAINRLQPARLAACDGNLQIPARRLFPDSRSPPARRRRSPADVTLPTAPLHPSPQRRCLAACSARRN